MTAGTRDGAGVSWRAPSARAALATTARYAALLRAPNNNNINKCTSKLPPLKARNACCSHTCAARARARILRYASLAGLLARGSTAERQCEPRPGCRRVTRAGTRRWRCEAHQTLGTNDHALDLAPALQRVTHAGAAGITCAATWRRGEVGVGLARVTRAALARPARAPWAVSAGAAAGRAFRRRGGRGLVPLRGPRLFSAASGRRFAAPPPSGWSWAAPCLGGSRIASRKWGLSSLRRV